MMTGKLKDVGGLVVIVGQITKIDSSNDTCSISADLPAQCVSSPYTKTQDDVPIYYYCRSDSTVRSNGAVEGAAGAFQVNDLVLCAASLKSVYNSQTKSYCFEIDKIERVLGHVDGRKTCGNLLMVIGGDLTNLLNYGSSNTKERMPYIFLLDSKDKNLYCIFNPNRVPPQGNQRPYMMDTMDYAHLFPQFDSDYKTVKEFLYPSTKSIGYPTSLLYSSIPSSVSLDGKDALGVLYYNMVGEIEPWQGTLNPQTQRLNIHFKGSLVWNYFNLSVYPSPVNYIHLEKVMDGKEKYTEKVMHSYLQGELYGTVQSGGYNIIAAAQTKQAVTKSMAPMWSPVLYTQSKTWKWDNQSSTWTLDSEEKNEEKKQFPRLSAMSDSPQNQTFLISCYYDYTKKEFIVFRRKSYPPVRFHPDIEHVDKSASFGEQSSLVYQEYFIETFDKDWTLKLSTEISNNPYDQVSSCEFVQLLIPTNVHQNYITVSKNGNTVVVTWQDHPDYRNPGDSFMQCNVYRDTLRFFGGVLDETFIQSVNAMEATWNLCHRVALARSNYTMTATSILFDYALRYPYLPQAYDAIPNQIDRFFYAIDPTKVSWVSYTKDSAMNYIRVRLYISQDPKGSPTPVFDSQNQNTVDVHVNNNTREVSIGDQTHTYYWSDYVRGKWTNMPFIRDAMPFIGLKIPRINISPQYYYFTETTSVVVFSKAVYKSHTYTYPAHTTIAAPGYFTKGFWSDSNYFYGIYASNPQYIAGQQVADPRFFVGFGTIAITYTVSFCVAINSEVIDLLGCGGELVDKVNIPCPHEPAVTSATSTAVSVVKDNDLTCTDFPANWVYPSRVHIVVRGNIVWVIYDLYQMDQVTHIADLCYWKVNSPPLLTDAKQVHRRVVLVYNTATNSVLFHKDLFEYNIIDKTDPQGKDPPLEPNVLRANRVNLVTTL